MKDLVKELSAVKKKLGDLLLAADPGDWHYNVFEDDAAWKKAWDEAKSEEYALESALSALDSNSE